MEVIIVFKPKNKNCKPPKYVTTQAAGVDICADISESILLPPLGRHLVPTGIFLEIPFGYEAQIRPRSGLSNQKGLTVLNAPGTIDSDYRGEVGIIIVNLSNQAQTIEPAERIAQMVFAECIQGDFIFKDDVSQLSKTDRGKGGFGSTGKK
jgi:dUTP pyrophosphatase